MPKAFEFNGEKYKQASSHQEEWGTRLVRELALTHRALCSGGVIRFNFAADGNCSRFFGVVREVMSMPEWGESFRTFHWPWYMPSVEEYAELAAASPFAEPLVWGENADRHFPDTDAMVAWIDQPSLVPFASQLPEHLFSPFRQAVIDRMIEACREDDGRCFETFRRINIFARK